MKIEKKKISTESKWSVSSKKGLAALMGLTAAASTLTACGAPQVAGGNIEEPEPEDVVTPNPVSSSSENQVVVDIPKSSSSVNMELLSSVSWQEPPIEAGVPIIDHPESTLVEVEPLSSSSEIELPIAAGVIIPPDIDTVIVDTLYLDNSSSSEDLSSSSLEIEPMAGNPLPLPEDYERESSSSSENAKSSSSVQVTPYDSYIHLCPSDNPDCIISSMVTTFERTDIDV